MGSGTFDAGAYRTYATTTRGMSTDEIYSSRSINKNLDPKGVRLRESRDSGDNPQSTPVEVEGAGEGINKATIGIAKAMADQ